MLLRHVVRARQATGSVYRVKDWLDGPGAIHRVNRRFSTHLPRRSLPLPPYLASRLRRTRLPGRTSVSRKPRAKRLCLPNEQAAWECAQNLRFNSQRRRCSMKLKLVFGVLMLCMSLAGRSYGFELLDRMLGLDSSGCDCCCEPQVLRENLLCRRTRLWLRKILRLRTVLRL